MDKHDYGDFQTPWLLADSICSILEQDFGLGGFTAILEPTCGTGNFLFAAASHWDFCKDVVGIEVNPEYCIEAEKFQKRFKSISVVNGNIFGLATKPYLKDKSKVLIIGNPPWADISGITENHPMKESQEDLKGLENLTGASNIDLGWYIILQLAREYRDTDTTIAFLCKSSAARKAFLSLRKENIPFSSFEIREIEAKDWFSVEISGALMVIQLCSDNASSSDKLIYTDLKHEQHIYREDHDILIKGDNKFLGRCFMEWRQGVKHDMKKVMEFSVRESGFRNGFDELVDLEPDLLFPLADPASLKNPVIFDYEKKMLVTQRKLNEDTSFIRERYPKTWEYLQKYKDVFDKRKSSIYRNSPDFSMFGIGDYSFSKYKVAIYGFRKEPFFSLLMPENGKPPMAGDTSYFLPFNDYREALLTLLILNSDKVRDFLSSLVFSDSKRPFTKKLLQKLDFSKILEEVSFEDIKETQSKFKIPNFVNNDLYEELKGKAASQ